MSKNKLRERTREHVPRYCAIFLTDWGKKKNNILFITICFLEPKFIDYVSYLLLEWLTLYDAFLEKKKI